jgi:hypothetical protein
MTGGFKRPVLLLRVEEDLVTVLSMFLSNAIQFKWRSRVYMQAASRTHRIMGESYIQKLNPIHMLH